MRSWHAHAEVTYRNAVTLNFVGAHATQNRIVERFIGKALYDVLHDLRSKAGAGRVFNVRVRTRRADSRYNVAICSTTL